MPITRSAMRTRIQRRIGDTSNSYGNAFYNDIIENKTMTWGGVIARYAPNFYLKFTSITGVDDATDSTYEFYQLPTDYRAFVRLERQYGTGAGRVFYQLRLVNGEDQNRYRLQNVGLLTLADSLTNYEQTVSIWDNRIRIIPAPVNNGYEYRFTFLRRPIVLSSDTDNLDIPDQWGEVIALNCAVAVLSQLGDNDTASMLNQQLAIEVGMLKDEYRRMNASGDGMMTLSQM